MMFFFSCRFAPNRRSFCIKNNLSRMCLAARHALASPPFPEINLVASFQTAKASLSKKIFCRASVAPLRRYASKPIRGDGLYAFFYRHRIIAPARKRIAAQDSPQAQRRSEKQPVPGHGFSGVFRTSGDVTASHWQEGRYHDLVEPQTTGCCLFHFPF